MKSNNFVTFDPKTHTLTCEGEWTLPNISDLKNALKQISWPSSGEIIIDGQAIKEMDSAGAWLLLSLIKKLQAHKITVNLQNFSEAQQKLLSLVENQIKKQKFTIPKIKIPNWLARIGKSTVNEIKEIYNYLGFIGKLTFETLRLLFNPGRVRWTAFMSIIETAGFNALPIVGLLSLMIGIVIAHQTGLELRKYGANIFIVDLLGFSVLREFGPLITAIIVAGRTGSAFTAQLGTMKVNQEIDALNTMGVTPGELLLLPRIIALLIALPLLTFWADIFGILGGMITTNNILNIGWYEFLHRFQREVPLKALLIGLGKAPVFALIIASIGCFQGMQVQQNADSVGKLTTRSVVLSIFFIVVVDAIFSILLSTFNL